MQNLKSIPTSFLLVALLSLAGGSSGAQPASREGHAPMDDGVRLYYRSVGGESNEAVIVPVMILTSPYFDALAKHHRIIYYDPRGRGRSDTGALADMSVQRNVRDLDALRAFIGLERIALIGYSGYGLEFALYALEHPDRVTRLVQLAPVPPRLSPWMEARGPLMEERVDRRALAEYERMRDSPPSDARERCQAYQRAYAPAVSVHPERIDPSIQCNQPTEWPENQAPLWGAFMPSITTLDLRPRLAELKMPRLVIWPERDAIPLEGVKEWLVPGAPVRLVTVEDADHVVYLDRPDVLMRALETFLGGAWPEQAQ